MSCGAETEAETLLAALTAGVSFAIPVVNLDDPLFKVPGGADSRMYQPVTRPENADLTSGVVGGSGTFDALMASASAHLKAEYDKGRITGAEYTRAYIELTQAAMGNAVQFVLGREQAFWQAQAAQVAAITGRMQLETAKVQLVQAQIEALVTKTSYAQTKLKLSTESVQYCIGKYNLDNLLPAQQLLLREQAEVQRAQTADQRTDGATVVGVAGKQKDLYAQQITSYQRDAEVKVSKLFTDAWITQKTVDEALVAPNGFTNASLDTILSTLKVKNGLS